MLDICQGAMVLLHGTLQVYWAVLREGLVLQAGAGVVFKWRKEQVFGIAVRCIPFRRPGFGTQLEGCCAPREAAGDGPSTWVPAVHMGDSD